MGMSSNSSASSGESTKADPLSFILPLGKKLAYGLGAASVVLLMMIFNTWLLKYYTDIIVVDLGLLGIAFLIFMAWNMVNDPLFGYLMDKTKTKWGRRIPYIIFFAPVLTVTFILLWTPPTPASDLITITYFLLILFIFDTSLTFITIAKSSLFPEISMDEKQRTNLAFVATILTVPCMGVALVVPFFFGNDANLFKIFMTGVAFFTLFSWFILAKKIRETRVFMEVDKPLSLIKAIKYTIKSRSFLIFLAFNFLIQTTLALLLPGLPFIIEYVLIGSLETILGGVSALAGIIVSVYYILKLRGQGVKKPFLLSAICIGVGGLLYTSLNHLAVTIIAFFLMGVSFPAAYILYDVAMGEIIDEDEMKTGIRREGTFYGVNNFSFKPCISLGIFILGTMLAAFGYVKNVDQTPLAQFGIKLAVFGIPAILMLFGAIAIYFFPIYGDYLKKIKAEIAGLHKAKLEKFKDLE
ncbi:MAG: MFS transporter [Candidatus Helarchaeota archaeon]|nr:MFS transporter [Candidatus Helarchaeota archaeon]